FQHLTNNVQHLALMVDHPPQIMYFTIDLNENLIEVPSPVGVTLRPMDPLLTYFTCEYWTKSVPPIAHRFMTDVDTPFMEKVFDVAKRKGKSDIHHHRQADDLRRRLEIAEGIICCHSRRVKNDRLDDKLFSSDKP